MTKIHVGLIKLIPVIFILFMAGCSKEASISKSVNKALREKDALARKTKIAKLQKIEETELRQFGQDIEVLRKRNPFIASSAATLEGSALELTGIMWDEANPKAIINEAIVGEGDTIGGKKVIKITQDTVILLEGDKEYTLKLKF